MFARIVSFQLKPNASDEFARLFNDEIVPALRRQRGFKDEMLFVEPGGPAVVAISLWDSRQDTESYARGTYPELLNTLARVIERAPAVRTFQLASSSLHAPGIAAFPMQSPITTPPGSPGA
jgi:heme-degrading monooxygenase HmoA